MNESEVARKKRRHRNERIAATILILLAAAAVAGIRLWNEQTRRELRRDQSYIPKPAAITPEALLLQELVRIDSSTPAGAAHAARWVHAYLTRHGVEAEIIASAPDRLNVYARIRGRNRGDGLLLFSHLDVVPAGAGWSAPAFEGRIINSAVFGRGAVDMKAMIICQLVAFVEVAKSGRPPEHDLVFLATADEETGSTFGMQWLLRHRPDVFEGLTQGITEGGVTEILRDQMVYFGIEIGGKQRVGAAIEAADQETLRALRTALEPYMVSRSPLRVLPEVREYFRHVAPTRYAFRPYLADVDWAIREGHFWRLPMAYRELTQNTIWCSAPVRDQGGWYMLVNLRNLPDEDPEVRLKWLAGLAAQHGAKFRWVGPKEGPAALSRTDTPLFAILRREAERRYRVASGTQIGYRTASDSRFLRSPHFSAYGVSPYPVTLAESLAIHGTDERLRLNALAEGVAFMRNVVADWAGSD